MGIIAISGKIGAGKDTIAQIIQYLTTPKNEATNLADYFSNKWKAENSTWKVKKFAYKLKQMVSLLTGIPVEDLEKQEVKDMTFEELYKNGFISEDFYKSLDDN